MSFPVGQLKRRNGSPDDLSSLSKETRKVCRRGEERPECRCPAIRKSVPRRDFHLPEVVDVSQKLFLLQLPLGITASLLELGLPGIFPFSFLS